MHSRLTPHKAERIFFDEEKNTQTMTTIITISINLCVFIFVSETGDLLAHVLLTSNRISQSCQYLKFRVLYADKIINSKGEKKIIYVIWFFLKFKVTKSQLAFYFGIYM